MATSSANLPATSPPPTSHSSGTMVGTPSFVWVTSPRSAASHQAELLQIREDGYLVKWSVSGKEELISSDSRLEQELPNRRRRRRSSAATMTESGSEEEAERRALVAPPPPVVVPKKEAAPETPLLTMEANNTSGSAKTETEPQPTQVDLEEELMSQATQTEEEDNEDEEEEYVEEAKPPPKKKKKRATGGSKGNKENKNVLWKSQPHSTKGKSQKSSKNNAATTPEPEIPESTHPSPHEHINLFKLNKLVRTTTEARVAQLLEAYGYASAASFVTEFFLFCSERQSCWQRRNNDTNPIWSQSAILQKYSFTNVYRELDRGTCYVRFQFTQHLLDYAERQKLEALQKKSSGRKQNNNNNNNSSVRRVRRRDWIQQLLWTSYCYRQVNRIESFLDFGGIPKQKPADLKKYFDFLHGIQEANDDAHDSFFASTYPTPSFEEYEFHMQQLNQANGWLLKSIAGRLAQCRTVHACWDQISKRLPGMAKYLDIAWQVLCDLMETGCLLVGPHSLGAMDCLYLGPQSKKILSSCWKDRQVDDGRAIDLLKLLTTQQQEIFASIGVEFPAWSGRPMTIKDLAHCLGQYSKYVKIQSDLKRGASMEGHHLLASKSYLDFSSPCRFCKQISDEGLFCDACLCFYCGSCEKESCAAAPDCWTCTPCKDLDQLQYVD